MTPTDDTDDARRAILEQVRAGLLSPEEAADRLDALDELDPTDAASAPADDAAPPRVDDDHRDRARPSSTAGDRPVRRVHVISGARPVRVVGDPTVHQAVVSGPHSVSWEGDTMVVHTGSEASWDDIAFSRRWRHDHDRSYGHGRERSESRGGDEAWGGPWVHREQYRRSRRAEPLVVRMKPELDLEFTMDAGTLVVEQVLGAIRGRLSAGRATIDGFAGPVDLAVAAGDLRATGRLTKGDSRIQCDVGRVTLTLLEGSDVRIIRHVSLGSFDSESDLVGSGRASLDVTVSVGSVRVRTPNGSSRVRSA